MVFDFVLICDYFWFDFNLKLFEKIKKKIFSDKDVGEMLYYFW